MARTGAAAVKLVLLRDYDTVDNPALDTAIETASATVDDIVTKATARGITVPNAARLELIERWLAAHDYTRADPPWASESTAGASGSKQGQTGMGLEASFYGQTAMRLDTTGVLRGLDKGTRAVLGWMGKAEPDQATYDERN
jgi:hypothetical protein